MILFNSLTTLKSTQTPLSQNMQLSTTKRPSNKLSAITETVENYAILEAIKLTNSLKQPIY